MDVRDLSGRWVLVTGAASGIGKATALECARRGANLALCDLNDAGLVETERAAQGEGRRVIARRVDVAQGEEMREFAAQVHRECEAVDLLVNNAGVAIGAGFLDTSLEDWDWIVGVNLRGVVHGCHFFVPAMIRRGPPGHVVIVSSMAGYTAAEGLAAYCTTKSAVLGLSEALSDELARQQIGVTAICPGIIDTPITRSTPLRGIYDQPGARETMVERYRKRGYGAERVARGILAAVQRGAVVAPISPEARILYVLSRLSPSLLRRLRRRVSARGRRELAAAAGR